MPLTRLVLNLHTNIICILSTLLLQSAAEQMSRCIFARVKEYKIQILLDYQSKANGAKQINKVTIQKCAGVERKHKHGVSETSDHV